MARKRQRKKRRSAALVRGWFAQPPAGFYGRGVLHLDCAGGMEVENCRGVLKYTDDTVELDMGRQRLCVRGEGLALAELAGRNLFVKGQVFSIELKNNDGKGGGWRDAGMAAGQGAVSGGRRRR